MDAALKLNGTIIIDDIGTFAFNPQLIKSKRPEIFQLGHFSVFDIIAHLNKTGAIEAEYHFDEKMNTYVVDSINGIKNWWYRANYHRGWLEGNVFRMDHYPVKDKMFIQIYQTTESDLELKYSGFRNQVSRSLKNGTMIIQEVTIRSKSKTYKFENVTVEAHNLRNDTFKPEVITAIDVILSLADQGKISYDLQWYSQIGNAEVKNYFLDRIDEDKGSYRGCGYVYECGEKRRPSNHIHLPSDIRVLNSPEYMLWIWMCM